MKLINFLIRRITVFFAVIMLLWGGVFLWMQMREIHLGNDEGLINLKQEFVLKANTTKGFAENMEEEQPLNLRIKEITFEQAEHIIENFQTTKVYFTTELEDEEVRMLTSAFYCEQNGKYYQLQFFTSTVETNDIIENILYLTSGLLVVLIITLISVSKFIVSRANKPFYQLLNELKRFRVDNSKNIVLPKTEITEYAQLNATVHELISKNINIFTEQKEFIENCSHELQTPLAVAIAKLELLIGKYQKDETYIKELTELASILSRMKRLNSSLLLLSKIKNNQFTGSQKIDLSKEIQEVLDELSDFIDYKEITVTFEKKQTLEKEMNADLVHILFTNLIKNATTHNIHGGKIEITSTSSRIIIANTGVHPLEDIFTRYNSHQTTFASKSSGIGLSIVKSIVDLYKIRIEYRFEAEAGKEADKEAGKHIFILNF
ncbi:MAG: HAMP domain-containing histidine kinase [Bacteroidales bacterium]|jgi:signal transduction histidine kinase|nr:HAMP domain-containing histidine kinase [Bacteroidales bacterium]